MVCCRHTGFSEEPFNPSRSKVEKNLAWAIPDTLEAMHSSFWNKYKRPTFSSYSFCTKQNFKFAINHIDTLIFIFMQMRRRTTSRQGNIFDHSICTTGFSRCSLEPQRIAYNPDLFSIIWGKQKACSSRDWICLRVC